MPIGVYVRTKTIIEDRLRMGLAAGHVEDFTGWLRQRRYTEKTIVERIRLLACWTHWARSAGYELDTIRAAHAASSALIVTGHRPRFRGDVNKDAVETGKLFIAYLEDRECLARLPKPTEPPLLAAFKAWAREQQGLAETTLAFYAHAIVRSSRHSARIRQLMMPPRSAVICWAASARCLPPASAASASRSAPSCAF